MNTPISSYSGKSPTYAEIASKYSLWMEYADPSGHCSEEWFNTETIEAKIAFIEGCFGPEQLEEEG